MAARIIAIASALGASLALAGCTGGSTYGTGTSQEVQLVSDLASVVALGSGEEKQAIDYSSRPKLVKAPATGTLPAPQDDIGSQDSGYFPNDVDEAKKARRRKITAGEVSDRYSPSDDLRKFEGGDGPKIEKVKPRLNYHEDRDPWNPRQAKKERAAVLARRAELRGAQGPTPRRYLTDPPVEYRTPADTAEVGVTGTREKVEKKRVRDARDDPFS